MSINNFDLEDLWIRCVDFDDMSLEMGAREFKRLKYLINGYISRAEAAEKELAALREQKIQPAPVAVPDEIVRDDADGYWMYKGERVSATAKEWYNQALADVLRLNSGSVDNVQS